MADWKAVLESVFRSHLIAALCAAGVLIALEAFHLWLGLRAEQSRIDGRRAGEPHAGDVTEIGGSPEFNWHAAEAGSERQRRV
jgi:hypothetical protein